MKNLVDKTINANLINGINTLTGKLFFYDEEFAFKADSVNSTIDMGHIKYSDIQAIELVNTMAIIPNAIQIKAKDKVWKFVVVKRRDIIDFLKAKMSKE